MQQRLTDLADQGRALGELLQSRRLSVVTAESCTGGGIAQVITDQPGSSAWFGYGFITYSNRAKQQTLGVPADVIDEHGAVSEAVVLAMARGALVHSDADLSISVSGIAGPGGGTPDKPVGTVWIGWGLGEGVTKAQCFHLPGDRAEVRHRSIVAAIDGLMERLVKPSQ